MDAKYIIEWKFTPKDYFKVPRHIECENYEMWISQGKVKAEVNEEDCEDVYRMMENLHSSLQSRFIAVELKTLLPFHISNPSVYKLYSDGHEHYYLQSQSISMSRLEIEKPVLQIIDENGNINSNFVNNDKENEKLITELLEKYRETNSTVKKVIISFQMASEKPKKELVYLYEVWEALRKKLGGEEAAKKILSVTKEDKKKLAGLANNPEIRQGRHTGNQIGNTRDAKKEELQDARRVASKMIVNYLNHLESQQS